MKGEHYQTGEKRAQQRVQVNNVGLRQRRKASSMFRMVA